MKKILFTLVVLGMMTTVFAQTEVTHYVPGTSSDGVVYYLPQTEFRIAVTATRTTRHPGSFHNYAQRFLRTDDVIHTESTEWKIDNVQIVPWSAPDTSKVYLVQLKKNSSAPLCSLTDEGVLLSINANTDVPQAPQLNNIKSATSDKMNSRDFLNQEILAATSELKMAELTVAEIYNIRESRGELTKGEADYMPKDGEQLKLMLNKLDEQEKALLQLFKGYSDTETKTWFFTYTPSIDKEKDIIARFSNFNGVVDKDNLSGAPIYIIINNKKTVPYGKSEVLDKKLIDKVVYYNIPSLANVQMDFEGNSLVQMQTPIAQFGHLEYLTEDLFNKRATCHIWFDPITGNIKKIEDDGLKK